MSISLVVGAFAVLIGGVVQGCTGFGFGMVVLTPMLFLMDQREAVPMILMLSMLNTVPTAFRHRDKIRISLVGPLLTGGVFGIPIGIAAIVALNGPVFRVAVGASLVLFASLLASGWKRPIKRTHFASLPIGFLSGIMNGSTSMTGPPVIVFLSNQDIPKDVFRANIVTYFSLMNVVSLSLFTWRGLLNPDVLTRTATLAPVLLVGTWLGALLSHRVSESLFRKITLACAGAMGLVLVVRNLLAMV